jgi:hypothetical protein
MIAAGDLVFAAGTTSAATRTAWTTLTASTTETELRRGEFKLLPLHLVHLLALCVGENRLQSFV